MKKIIVVGAGIAGLSAAIYAQRSGFDVTLVEQHSIVGGMCTSWRRKGYLFEGAIHWLTGSSPKTEIHQMWTDTGALVEGVTVHLREPFRAVEWEGKTLRLYRDIKRSAQEMIALSPRDEKRIRRMVKDVKALRYMQMPVMDIKGVKTQNPKRMSIGSLFKMIPAFPVVVRMRKLSSKEYAAQFEHPGVRRLIDFIPDGNSAIALIFTLSTLDIGDGGYPKGGSLAMTERMAQTFKNMGGKLLLKTKVNKVVIKDGAAVGVTLENETLSADAIIVTQETIAALEALFDTPIEDTWIKEMRDTTKLFVCTFVSVGVRARLPEILPNWQLDTPIQYAGKTVTEIGFGNYAGYEGYAPEGCSALTLALMGDTYDFWKQAKDDGRYEDEKRKLADQIIAALCKKYPQAEGNIDVIDIATPLTYKRYTGAWRGSWMSLTGPGDTMKPYPGFSENISGLYFAGHRIKPPGGLPTALSTGRAAAQMVCRQFDVVFK